MESPEQIPTNILADRLKRLVSLGIVQSRRYSDHPPRLEYQLTAKGEDLRSVLRAMVEWGVKHAGGRCLRLSLRGRKGVRRIDRTGIRSADTGRSWSQCQPPPSTGSVLIV